MKRYKPFKFNDTEVIERAKKSHFFNEAVFRSDNYANELYSLMIKTLKDNKNPSLKYDVQICKFLTSIFSKYNIIFIPEGNYYNNGFASGINEMQSGEQTLLIKVLCSLSIDKIFDSPIIQQEFLKEFKQLISHELVHRGQYIIFNKNKVIKDKIYFSKNKTGLAYYSQKHEIMAYACLIVEELRFQDLTDKDILLFCKNRENFKNYSCETFDMYKEVYGNSNVFERLLKYIYEYLKGDLTKNILKVGI
jgi:hypothetical protein